jgi:hypothetical protein
MGKKMKAAVAEPVAAVADASETIARKKENAKLLEKQMKHITAKVLASLDLKQTTKAVVALQALKKRTFAKSKGLLDSAESQITLSFTMTALPNKPSQRP